MTADPAADSEQSKTRDYAATAIATAAGVLRTHVASGDLCLDPSAERSAAHLLARQYMLADHGWVRVFAGDLDDLSARIDAICDATPLCRTPMLA